MWNYYSNISKRYANVFIIIVNDIAHSDKVILHLHSFTQCLKSVHVKNLLKAEGVLFIQISKYLRINKEVNVWQT